MKNICYLIITLLFIISSQDAIAQRDVAWLGGIAPTSHGLNSMRQLFANNGFPMNNMINYSQYQPQLGVDASASSINNMINSNGGNNVLGLGHDYGGIILRKAQLDNPNIGAIILNGVPNQGSNLIEKTIDNGGNPAVATTVEALLQGIQNIKKGDNCNDCQVVEEFEEWVGDIELFATAYQYIIPGGDIDNLGLPTVPTAVFWGDSEMHDSEQLITSLMSSRAQSVTPFPNLYTACVEGNRDRARDLAKHNFELAALKANNNFFSSLITALGTFIASGPSPAGILSFANTFISTNVTSRILEIERIRDKNLELARLMRCELANQVLAAEWALIVSGGELEIVEEEVEVVNEDYIGCLMECEEINYEMNININCSIFCDDIPETATEIITTYTTLPSDGLYSMTEQSLEGAGPTLRLALTNHFEETKYLHPSVNEAYTDLFNGDYGPAFEIQ